MIIAIGSAIPIALAAPPAGAATTAAATTSFNGSCHLTGGLLLPVTGSGQSGGIEDFIDDGTCTGSLDGAPSASYAVRAGWSTSGIFLPGLPVLAYLPVLASGAGSIEFGATGGSPTLSFTASQLLTGALLNGDDGGQATAIATSWGTGLESVSISVRTIGTMSSG